MQHSASGVRERQPRGLDFRVLLLSVAFLGSGASLAGQSPPPTVLFSPGRFSLCSLGQFQGSGPLTFRQRACWFGSKTVSPGAAARAAFSSGIGQWRNTPHLQRQDADDYPRRFAGYYIRRSARETGELLAGYFDREDPRPHTSGESALSKRLRSALFNVVIVKTQKGGRPALAPIAGSLAAGFAGAAWYPEHTGPKYALEGAGATYGGYFARALYQEFRPDIRFYARHWLRK